MNDFDWSGSAYSIRHKFTGGGFSVFVEGKDDVIFWKHRITSLYGSESFSVEYVCPEGCNTGGEKELRKKINKIIDENAKIIVAMDGDYSEFIKDNKSHPQIITTYGFSVENTMYCPTVLNHFIRIRSRNKSSDESNNICLWYEYLVKEINDLLILDIANEKFKKGHDVLGDKLERFLKNNGKSHLLDSDLINSRYDSCRSFFTEKELETVRTLLEHTRKDRRFIIRGHVLTGGIRNLLRNILRKHDSDSAISNENLYEATVEKCSMNCKCDDAKHLKTAIGNAIQAVI